MGRRVKELLSACGSSSKVMKLTARVLREVGLEAYADSLERARTNLDKHVVIAYEDTKPIDVSGL